VAGYTSPYTAFKKNKIIIPYCSHPNEYDGASYETLFTRPMYPPPHMTCILLLIASYETLFTRPMYPPPHMTCILLLIASYETLFTRPGTIWGYLYTLRPIIIWGYLYTLRPIIIWVYLYTLRPIIIWGYLYTLRPIIIWGYLYTLRPIMGQFIYTSYEFCETLVSRPGCACPVWDKAKRI